MDNDNNNNNLNNQLSTDNSSPDERFQPSISSDEGQENTVRPPKKGMPKRKLAIVLGIAVVLIIGLAAFLFLRSSDDQDISLQPVEIQQPVQTLGAVIATTEGTAEFSSDGEEWTKASGGESLAQLDYIRTLDESRAIVLFDDGSIVRLAENTQIYLSAITAESSEVTLQEGKIYSRVVESENRNYAVVTANERFGALGTAFTTSSDETKDELEVYQSDVEVNSEKLTVSEGNKYDTESKETEALDISALKDDEFTQWNKEKDSEIDEFKDKLGVLADKEEEEVQEPESPSAGVTLSGVKTDKGVKLTWSVEGLDTAQGFKMVRSATSSKPTFGIDASLYVSNPKDRQGTWQDSNGGTHYYRVCIYSGSKCSYYSNAVKVESPKVQKETVKSGEVSLTISGNKISWSLAGGNAPHGFKVVLSSSPEPVYPEDSIQYVGADTKSATLPEKSNGTYYVRVCKFTNGTQEKGCVDYSNQIEYVVD